jgi:hypothetical protein
MRLMIGPDPPWPPEPFHLGGAELTLEDAALDVVKVLDVAKVLSAGLEHAGVALGGGVVHRRRAW